MLFNLTNPTHIHKLMTDADVIRKVSADNGWTTEILGATAGLLALQFSHEGRGHDITLHYGRTAPEVADRHFMVVVKDANTWHDVDDKEISFAELFKLGTQDLIGDSRVSFSKALTDEAAELNGLLDQVKEAISNLMHEEEGN